MVLEDGCPKIVFGIGQWLQNVDGMGCPEAQILSPVGSGDLWREFPQKNLDFCWQCATKMTGCIRFHPIFLGVSAVEVRETSCRLRDIVNGFEAGPVSGAELAASFKFAWTFSNPESQGPGFIIIIFELQFCGIFSIPRIFNSKQVRRCYFFDVTRSKYVQIPYEKPWFLVGVLQDWGGRYAHEVGMSTLFWGATTSCTEIVIYIMNMGGKGPPKIGMLSSKHENDDPNWSAYSSGGSTTNQSLHVHYLSIIYYPWTNHCNIFSMIY